MGSTGKDILNSGNLNRMPAAFKACQLGTLIHGEGAARLVRESVAVASDAATPTYTVKRLLSCKVSGGSAGNGEKLCQPNGEALARVVRETLAVASAAAAPTYPAIQLLYAKTIGTGAPAVKIPGINGATPSAGDAAPSADGTSIAFHAETTGTGTADVAYLTAGGVAVPNAGGTSIDLGAETAGADCVADIVYLTSDPPNDADGVAATALSAEITGL